LWSAALSRTTHMHRKETNSIPVDELLLSVQELKKKINELEKKVLTREQRDPVSQSLPEQLVENSPMSSSTHSIVQSPRLHSKERIPKKIKLNVGGKVFATTLSTLLKEKDSFFSLMFSGQYCTDPDEDGEYFIDRSYTHFDKILNYLRTDTIFLPEDEKSRKELLIEAQFYQLNSLVQLIKRTEQNEIYNIHWSTIPEQKSLGVQISSDGMTAQGRGCVVSSKPITSGRQYFELRFDDLSENCNRIGVVDKIPLNLGVQPNEGWLYCPACGKGYGYLGGSFQGARCRQGDVFGIAIDMENRQLSFYKNNVFMGVVATSLPPKVYILAYLNNNCKKITLIQREQTVVKNPYIPIQ
jgi:hypothetical protein